MYKVAIFEEVNMMSYPVPMYTSARFLFNFFKFLFYLSGGIRK